MIRIFISIALLFAAVFAFDWLGGVPVSVAIEWPGSRQSAPARHHRRGAAVRAGRRRRLEDRRCCKPRRAASRAISSAAGAIAATGRCRARSRRRLRRFPSGPERGERSGRLIPGEPWSCCWAPRRCSGPERRRPQRLPAHARRSGDAICSACAVSTSRQAGPAKRSGAAIRRRGAQAQPRHSLGRNGDDGASQRRSRLEQGALRVLDAGAAGPVARPRRKPAPQGRAADRPGAGSRGRRAGQGAHLRSRSAQDRPGIHAGRRLRRPRGPAGRLAQGGPR